MPLTEKFIRKSAMQNFLSVIDQIAVVTGPASIDKDTVYNDLVDREEILPVAWIQTATEGDSVIGFVEGDPLVDDSKSYTHAVLIGGSSSNPRLILTTPLAFTTTSSDNRRIRIKVTMKEVPF